MNGITVRSLAVASGLTYRQINYALTAGLIPAVADRSPGTGHRVIWDDDAITQLLVFASLRSALMPPPELVASIAAIIRASDTKEVWVDPTTSTVAPDGTGPVSVRIAADPIRHTLTELAHTELAEVQ